ncbi:hypothetical protein VP01_392g11 [Puccinia sorghi]|uniref:Uncharacterized protein n=1 Tax=Puccinia sorghi TaxID=27349 RepID=A0A0L6UUG5_9BASI|nr:hypothetical protein VP01_392g11 [Puccinia sorghi]
MVTNAQLAVIHPAAADIQDENENHADSAASEPLLPETGSKDSYHPKRQPGVVPTVSRLLPSTIAYLPKETHDTKYEDVEEIKEAILGISRREAGDFVLEGRVFVDCTKFLRLTKPVLHGRALAMKHDPSSRITWSCPPEGPEFKWETMPHVNSQHPAENPTPLLQDLDATRMAYPDIKILSPQDDIETRNRIAHLKISHWSYFTLSTKEGFRALGFEEGLAR